MLGSLYVMRRGLSCLCRFWESQEIVGNVPHTGFAHIDDSLAPKGLSDDSGAAEPGTAMDVAHIDDLLANVDAAAGCGLCRAALGMNAGKPELSDVRGVSCVEHGSLTPLSLDRTYLLQNILEQNESSCQHYFGKSG